jgi:hypothetical protein
MKRFLQILLMTGMTMLWVLSPVSQTVQAERNTLPSEKPEKDINYGNYYTGRITFVPRIDFKNDKAKEYYKLSTKGVVHIQFPKDDEIKNAQIKFDGERIDIEFHQESRDKCWGVAKMWENGYGRIYLAVSDYYNATDESFLIPLSIGRLKTTTNGTQSSVEGDYCPHGGEGDGSVLKKYSLFEGTDAWGVSMDTITLKILEKSDGKLGGDCTIKDWNDWNGNGYTSSLYCYWYAFYHDRQFGDWRKKK